MPYPKTTWASGVTPVDEPEMTNLEKQYDEAVASINTDFLSAFVLTGFNVTKNGGNAKQADIALGTAYLKQTDGTLRQRKISSTSKLTVTANATYFLDIDPDGTLQWSTAHSATTNHLTLYSVPTDSSGNIIAGSIADLRMKDTTLIPSMIGNLLNGGTQNALHSAGSGTGLVHILDYTAPSDGQYRVACSFRINTTGTVTVEIIYVDTITSSSRTAYIMAIGDGGAAYVVLSGVSTPHAQYAGVPIVIDAKGGTVISCRIQNSAGSTSDSYSFIIERLA